MDFMHQLLGEDMEGAYVIAMLLGIAAGAAARLSRGFLRRGRAPGA
jgi:hypothetical protein